MVRIEHIDPEPIHRIGYRNARSGGGTESSVLEILSAKASDWASAKQSWSQATCKRIATSIEGRGSLLLGEVLEEHISMLAESGQLPPPSRMGVVLAGDLYSVPRTPTKRGGFGDVSMVWAAFADAARWVVGVAGNHDDFSQSVGTFGSGIVHLLDATSLASTEFLFGGVGQIVGNTRKPGKSIRRRATQDVWTVCLSQSPDVLVLHEGPGGDVGQFGNPALWDLIELSTTDLTICGHRHWDEPLAQLDGKQILNVDARVVVLS